MNKKTVSVIGLGYIGLPTAAILANSGYKVIGVDINQEIVNKINLGKTHFYEPDLDKLVEKNIQNGNLVASVEPVASDVFIICVPTPFKFIDNERCPDISYIEDASKKIAKFIKKGDLVILESTSPVGTTSKISEIINAHTRDCDGIFYAYCPERVLPGNIITELTANDRIVGGLDNESTKKTVDFYKKFVDGKVHSTNAETAEMCKLTENSYRDVNIAFANELSIISSEYNVNVRDLIRLANFHPRVNILQPGVGVGGHCIAVDPWFLISDLPKSTKLLRRAREINLYKTDWVKSKIKEKIRLFISKNNFEPVIACMGITFKPNVDDIRESPALEIALDLKNAYEKTIIIEPNLKKIDKLNISTIDFALNNADIFVFLVGHSHFSEEEFIKEVYKKDFIDFTGIINDQY